MFRVLVLEIKSFGKADKEQLVAIENTEFEAYFLKRYGLTQAQVKAVINDPEFEEFTYSGQIWKVWKWW